MAAGPTSESRANGGINDAAAASRAGGASNLVQPQTQAGQAPELAEERAAVIRFTPELTVRAIVFHLLDEGIALSVTEGSIRGTISRLGRQRRAMSIVRSLWEMMDHRSRLQWLLSESGSDTLLLDDRVAVITAAQPGAGNVAGG